MVTLQNDVNSFIDSSKSTTPVRQGKLPTPGVKQGLEKKEGLFRMHMMVRNSKVTVEYPVDCANRANESTMLPAPSSHQMSTSKLTRSVYHPYLHAN
jgi:hypothetical protein